MNFPTTVISVLMVMDLLLAFDSAATGDLGFALLTGLCAFYWWLSLWGER